MKKFALVLFLCLDISLYAQEIVTVENIEQFVSAIKSDVTIQLKGDWFHISDLKQGKQGDFYSFNGENYGEGLVISGVNNLKIIGLSAKPTKFVVNNHTTPVLTLKSCNNIVIDNLELGHATLEGMDGCGTEVLKLQNCKKSEISKSIIFGSGMFGISMNECSDINYKNITIRSCSDYILDLNKSNNIKFTECDFIDNRSKFRDFISINNCMGITFEKVNIALNNTDFETSRQYGTQGNCFIYSEHSINVQFKNSNFKYNSAAFLMNKSDAASFLECDTDRNNFILMFKK